MLGMIDDSCQIITRIYEAVTESMNMVMVGHTDPRMPLAGLATHSVR